MPEKQPLEGFTPLQLVFEAELIVLVGEFEEVEEFGASLHYGERGRLGVVD